MVTMRKLMIAVLVLTALPLTGARAGVRLGIGIALPGPYWYRPYYAYPYYYPPPPVYVAPPPVIVQPAPLPQPVAVAPPLAAAPSSAPEPVAMPRSVLTADAEPFVRQLSDPSERVRADAAMQLGRMKAVGAVDSLETTLGRDHSPAVREAAARALGLIGTRHSLAALQQAAQSDDDRDVRHSAQFAAEIIRSNLPRN